MSSTLTWPTGFGLKTFSTCGGLLEDAGFIRTLGLAQDGARSDAQLRDQREICDVVLKGLISVSKNFYLFELEHSSGMPLEFASFLSHDPDVVAQASNNATDNHSQMHAK